MIFAHFEFIMNVKNFLIELISLNEFLLKKIKMKYDYDKFFDINLKNYISKFFINILKFLFRSKIMTIMFVIQCKIHFLSN